MGVPSTWSGDETDLTPNRADGPVAGPVSNYRVQDSGWMLANTALRWTKALGRVCHQMGNKQGKQREPIDAQYLRPSGTLYTSCECTPRASLLTSQYRSMRSPQRHGVSVSWQGTSVRCAD